MKPNNKLRLLSWFFVLVWLVLIFVFSAQNNAGSNSTSYRISDIIVRIIHPDFETLADGDQLNRLWQVNIVIRKMAHFFLYTVLGALLYFAVSFIKLKPWVQLCLSLLLGLVLAGLDEFHQSLVPGRTPRLFDVGIDFLGIILGCFIIWLLMKLKALLSRKRNELSAET